MSDKKVARKVLSVAAGIDALKSGYAGGTWALGAVKRTRNTLRKLLPADEGNTPEIPREINHAGERFSWLQAEQGLTEEDILAMRRSARSRFTFWFLGAVAMIVWALVSGPLGLQGNGGLLDKALPWILVLPFLAKCVRWSYWSLQLRRRELLSFRQWLRSPGEWMGAMDDKVPAVTAFMALTAAAAVLAPDAAFASTPDLTALFSDPNADRLSTKWMQTLFPSAVPGSGVSQAQDTVSQMFGTINSTFAALAGFLLTWHTVAGTVATAHEGKVLGQRWHTIWAPIRVATGMGMLVPVKGYCMAQLLMLHIIFAGYNLADVVWNQYVTLVTGTSSKFAGTSTVTIPPDSMSQRPTLNALLKSELCFWTAAYNTPASGMTPPLSASQLNAMQPSGLFSSRANYNYPASTGAASATGWVWDYGAACGRITFPKTQASNPTSALSAPAAPIDVEETFSSTTSHFNTFEQARATAFGTLVAAVRTAGVSSFAKNVTADQGAQANLVTLMNSINSEFSTYKSSVLSAAGTLMTSLNTVARQDFATNAAKLGWAAAGVIQPQIVRANAAVVDKASELPKIDGPNPDFSKQAKEKYAHALANLDAASGKTTTADASAFNADTFAEDLSKSEPNAMLGNIRQGLNNFMSQAIANTLSVNPADPIGSIQNMGNVIMLSTEAWMLGMAVASGVTEAAIQASQGASNSWIPFSSTIAAFASGGAGFVKGVFLFITGVMNATGIFLLGFGAAQAIVLPLMGYSMWLFAIAGLITLNVEMVVGATWWAFSHVRMDGQELVDNPQKQGYVLAWNGMFRPTLMILGLIFANLTLSVTMSFVNQTFATASTVAQGSHAFGPVGWVVTFGFLLYLHYHMVVRSYAMITHLPDRVARWVGAGGENLGEDNENSRMTGVIAGAVYQGGSQTSGGIRSAFQGDKQAKAQQADAAKKEERHQSMLKALGGGGGAGGDGPPTKAGQESGASKISGANADKANDRPAEGKDNL